MEMKTYGIARLATKPTLREVEGQKVSNFRVCADKAYKKKNSTEFGHKLMFIDVTCWGPLAERVATKLVVGHLVLVEGELQERSYVSAKHGNAKVTVHEIVADNVRNLGAPKAKATAE